MPSIDDIRELLTTETHGPVLSVLVRTDPRDPANTRHVPAWHVALRSALQDIGAHLERDGDRDERLAFRSLQQKVQDEMAALSGRERGRGVAWFVTPDRALDRRFTLQQTPSRESVRWDARPFVLPLTELAGRGRPAAIVLVTLDGVRLLRWEGGRISEPPESVYDLELGDWRDYQGAAAANPARGQQTTSHLESYEHRVDAWRERFYKATGAALADRVAQLGCERVLLAAERGLAEEFASLLPQGLARDIVGEPAMNLMWEEPGAIADRLDGEIEGGWVAEVRAVLRSVLEAAGAGGAATLGADETLQALAAQRVERLILDPGHAFTVPALGPAAIAALRTAENTMVAECAVELALASGASVTSVPADEAGPLREAGGMAALLRY